MATKKAMLEYIFLFDPDTGWNTLSSFESDLSNFFASYGYQANVIRTIDGQTGRRIIQLERMDPMMAETNFHNKPVTMKDLAKLPKPTGVSATQKKLVKGVVK